MRPPSAFPRLLRVLTSTEGGTGAFLRRRSSSIDGGVGEDGLGGGERVLPAVVRVRPEVERGGSVERPGVVLASSRGNPLR